MKRAMFVVAITGFIFTVGCRQDPEGTGQPGSSLAAVENTPTFSLAWSEYPSWSVFGVADELGLIDGEEGKMGDIENQHGVDIVLHEAGYDSCLNMFAAENTDAVCITNMDALIVGRDGVAVLPTSTSNGADACLVTADVADIEALKQHKIYGLKGTVSEYCFARCLEKAGFNEADFEFTNQDPAIAAQNMQGGQPEHQAIMVWNPFVLQTLNDRSDVRVLFDSSEIEGEIVDMVVVGKDTLDKPGAENFVHAVRDAFYAVNEAMDDETSGDEVLVALGQKFSNLGLEDMKTVVQQTEFYKTPAAAKELFDGDQFKDTMTTVEKFCVDHGLVEDPSVGYGSDAGDAKLRFDSSYLD